MIEEQWQDVELNDGLQRMLQALLTTLMLAIDEQQRSNRCATQVLKRHRP